MIANKNFDLNKMIKFMSDSGNFFIEQLHINNLTLEEYANKMCNKGTVAYFEKDGIVQAMVIGYTDNMINNMSYITQVYVLPEYRKKGLASLLLDEYINYCKDKNIDGIWLTTQKDNYSAKKLYENKNFCFDNEYNNELLVKMVLDLHKN